MSKPRPGFRPRRSVWTPVDKLFQVRLELSQLEDRTVPNTYTVDNTSDSGVGSLRQAILDANANGGPDKIDFAILPAGSYTISPTSALPAIGDAVQIDATTEPGYAGTPVITLDGGGAGAAASGFTISARVSTIKGFAIVGFSKHGVLIGSNLD